MISVEQALEKVLNYVDVLEEEERPILDCLGQVLAEDIHANIDVPPLDNAAMDGYAVQSRDTQGACVRIMTGAAIPKGADSVVRFEDTDEELRGGSPTEIGILREAKAGLSVRRAGESIAKGSLVFSKGVVLRPSEVGVLASLGHSVVKVIRRPVLAILATGDEVIDIDKPLPPGKIYNSNTYSLAAMALRYGGIPKILGVALDSEDSLVSMLQHGVDADVLITIGGVSMGDYDIVKDVLAKQGEIVFWKVRMKPGKPLAFGRIREIPHLGLPGNPVSCMVNFELFVRPAILKMMGKKTLSKPTIEAVLENSIANNDGRRTFARVIVEKRDGKYLARLTGPQGSGIITSMALANGLAIVPEDKPKAEKGEVVQVMMLDWNEDQGARLDI